MKLDRTVLILAIVLVLIFAVVNNKKQPLQQTSLQATLGGDHGLKLRQELKYETTQESLPDGMVKSESQIKSPVGAKITVSAASADTVTVRNVWQEGEKTYIVLAPMEKVREQEINK